MKLELDWEMGIFRGLRALWQTFTPSPPPPFDPARAAVLTDHQRTLTVIAQVVSGEPLRVLPARDVGGVRGRDLLLPPFLDLAPTPEANRELYILRTVLSATVYRLGIPSVPVARWERVMRGLKLLKAAADQLEQEMPHFAQAHQVGMLLMRAARPASETLRGQEKLLESARILALEGGEPWQDAGLCKALELARLGGPESPGLPLWGELIPWIQDGSELGVPGSDPHEPATGTEKEAPAIEEVRRVVLKEQDQEAAVLMHTFEKIDTADNYHGGARDTDGTDELDEQLEALSEVDLSEVIRGGEQAKSILKADIQLDADVPDVATISPDERGIAYDEWDGSKRIYHANWCTVYPTPMPGGDGLWAKGVLQKQRKQVAALRRRLEVHRSQLRPLDRQLDGEDVDIAALVDEHAAVQAGQGGSPRLYVRQARQRRDFATTVLLDISLSTDAWVADRRVLDVAREAVLVLGEVADQLGDRLQILAFASHTRNKCRVWEVRRWGEAWTVGKARLGRLEPQGYTRIGPAIRHATANLASTQADGRLLLLISDGKPSDYDRYEGRYGIADVRQALREAEQRGITPHALAIDSSAKDYLPAMFGPGAWHILPRPECLPEVLATVYGKLTGR